MARINLTAGRISSAICEPGKKQAFLWDSSTPGLGLRVTPGRDRDTRAFIFQGRLANKSIRITIGDSGSWDIDKAREHARTLQQQIDIGIDPRKVKADRIAKIESDRVIDERKVITFGSAWGAYLAAHQKRWSLRHHTDHGKAASEKSEPPGPLAEFLPLKLSDITSDLVKGWLDKEVAKRPTFAAIAFRKLRAFLNWCADQSEYEGLVSGDACSRKVARDKLPKNKAKTDCLQREQLPSWFTAVRALSSPTVSAYLQGLLLTGARREELANLAWANVDLKWKAMTIRDKVEGERTIPLTPYVENLLRELKVANDTPPPEFRILHGKKIRSDTENWKPSPWVFSSKTSETGRIVEPRIGHNRALATAGLPDLTLHGLRRSFGTLAEWVECPVGISAQIMGHAPSALAEKHYRQRPLDLLRMWHTKIEAWILEQAGIEQPKADQQSGLRAA